MLFLITVIIVWYVFQSRNKDEKYIILKILHDVYPNQLFGRDIVKRSRGALSRGSIFVSLFILEEDGMVSSEFEDVMVVPSQKKRKLYTITSQGLTHLIRLEAEKGYI